MTTKLKLFNKILIKLGSETITEITDESKTVRVINEIYDDIVKEELQKHNWIFANKRATLTGTEVEGRFKYCFDLPFDCLLLLKIDGFNALSTYPYQYGAFKQYDVAGRKIYSNKNKIDICYTSAVDENMFDFNFTNAVCSRICYELAEVLTQDDQKKQTWMNEYLIAIKDAKRVNAIQLPNAALGSGVLERARVW